MVEINFNEEALRAMIKETIDKVFEDNLSALQTQSQINDDKPMGVREAAEFLGLAVNTVYNNVAMGNIPHMKRGKFLYFSKEELTDYLKQGKRKTVDELMSEHSN